MWYHVQYNCFAFLPMYIIAYFIASCVTKIVDISMLLKIAFLIISKETCLLKIKVNHICTCIDFS